MQRFCEKCGNRLCDGADVCLKCGNFVNDNEKKIQRKFNKSIVKSIVIGIIVMLFSYFLFWVLLFSIWIFGDIVQDRECKNKFGEEYKLERGSNIDNGLCCVNGEPGNNCKWLNDSQ